MNHKLLLAPPARYFPVKPFPLRMEAGLLRHGTDLGNGAADSLFFQVDTDLERYLHAKRAVPSSRHAALVEDAAESEVHSAVVAWICATLASEHPDRLAAAGSAGELHGSAMDYEAISREVQEDMVVLRRLPNGASRAIVIHVSFPSGWRPERIHGASFGRIHAPVPDFAKHAQAERSMVEAMVERGPYLRFVWTVTADDWLDHHPDEGRRRSWQLAERGFLRVERQVTVPFRRLAAALFLIRTYVYPFESLTETQRRTLASALEVMPETVARYKGLDLVRDTVLRVLRVSGPC